MIFKKCSFLWAVLLILVIIQACLSAAPGVELKKSYNYTPAAAPAKAPAVVAVETPAAVIPEVSESQFVDLKSLIKDQIKAEVEKNKPAISAWITNLIGGLLALIGTFILFVINSVFTWLRAKVKFLQYTQLDEKVQKKLVDTWAAIRYSVYDDLKAQVDKGELNPAQLRQALAEHGFEILNKSLGQAEWDHLGVETKDEAVNMLKTAFGKITDGVKGKFNFDVGKDARLTVGLIDSPLLGGTLKGASITKRF